MADILTDIIKSSAIVPATKCSKACRVVLRDLGDEYVTHMENLSGNDKDGYSHDSYYWGHYFDNEIDAMRDFNDRVVKLK